MVARCRTYVTRQLLLVLFLVAIHACLLHARFTMFAGNDAGPSSPPLITVPTQDFFQAKPSEASYQRTGPAVFLRGRSAGNGTVCNPAAVRPASNATISTDAAATAYLDAIMIADWSKFKECGIRTLTQLARLAANVSLTLPAAGYPPARTLVILLNTRYTGMPGNPSFEPYMARSAFNADGRPPAGLDVVLVTTADQKVVVQAKKRARAVAVGQDTSTTPAFIATVEQEAGPWNALFLSLPYLISIYLLFSLNVAVILYAIFRLLMLLRSGDFVFGLRNIIFLLGILGSSLYSASMLLRTYSYTTKMLEGFATFLISVAFHLLLYLWSVFLMQVRHNKSVYYFRGLVIFGASVVTLTFISTIVTLSIRPNRATRVLLSVLSYLLPITQMVIGVAFLGYAIKFLRRRETVKISKNTYQALTRLSQVAVIAFIAYFAVAVTNLDAVIAAMVTPGALAAACILRIISASVRGMALLMVLGVRVKKSESSVTSTVILSQTGGKGDY